MKPYENRYWTSDDEVRLHYRDYPGREDRPPILCLPGLTRNARDYEDLAERLAGGWRVITVDFRGRGESGPAKDPMSYMPMTYVRDIELLIDQLGCERIVSFGTSLGGIVTMLLAATRPGVLAGALLNDVGPEIEPAGLGRIRSYVGKANTWPTWMHAARGVQEGNADVYPNYGVEDWLAMAKRLYRLNSSGRIVLDYDMKIAEPFRVPGNETGADLWPVFDALKKVPTLIVRGGRSDVFGAETAKRMLARLDRAALATVRDVGHAPTLSEPEAAAAIDHLLATVTKEPVAA
ncbi:alpha/beta hydrolase [Sphingomonas sp.]|jgi:pimeloyl-ACP methyl ester carboxylesterase|uniref:alpha/beta fold hydrolase n=1 Tax=Sphingomonas sp. TaxID=28214 RepID=UPI002E345133|nr:alpha/beta hydrolase [Sphingomonas sp.]HEX4694140.1 alpha/beta hydrolase [Sphingomonas sp.]